MRADPRLFPLLLILILLSACGAPARQEPGAGGSPAADAASLPETAPAGEVSAPAIVTEGRAPAKDYDLPLSPAAQDEPRYHMGRWASGTVIEILAEAPEADAAFYGLPSRADSAGETALIRWGDSLAEFDWNFATPRTILPRMDCFDVDSDGTDELIVICYTGSGTGVSIEELHIVEKSPDGTLTDFAFPESLWQDQVPALFDTALADGRAFAILGHELVEIDGRDLDLETASSGLIAGFTLNDSFISFRGAFCLCYPDSAVPQYIAETSADVLCADGVFTLKNFHLYSYDQ